MRKPLSPIVTVSRNGQLALCEYNDQVSVLDLTSGTVTALDLPHEAVMTAISPHASQMAIAGYDQLSLIQGQPPYPLLATIDLPERVHRLVVGDHHLVVAVTNIDDERSTLWVWRGQDLHPVFPETGFHLGEVAPDGLQIDESQKQALVWGLQGTGAFSGAGDSFVRLVALTETTSPILWDGSDCPIAQPAGFLYGQSPNHIGVYDHDRVVFFQVRAEDSVHTLAEYAFGNLEAIAISPSGTHVLGMGSEWDGNQDHYHLRVITLPEPTPVQDATFDTLGQFPAFAINDSGQALLVYSEKPNQVFAFSVEGDHLAQKFEISI